MIRITLLVSGRQLHMRLALALLSTWFRGDRQLNVTATCHLIPGGRALTNHRAGRHPARVAVLDSDLRIGDELGENDQVLVVLRGDERRQLLAHEP